MKRGRNLSTHPSAVLLQAWQDGEVGARRRMRLQSHVEACARCRDSMAELRELSHDFTGALARLDRAGEAALSRLSAQGPEAGLTAVAKPVPDRPWLRAAIIAALLITASSFAGLSALWLRDQLSTEETAVTAVMEAPEAAPGYQSGFTLTPTTAALRIELTGLAADSRVELRLVDDAQVSIDVSAADAPVRFSDPRAGRMDVTVNGRADVTVALPRSLANVTIAVDGVVRATKAAGTLDVRPEQNGVTVVANEG